jgi:hypothetical protein
MTAGLVWLASYPKSGNTWLRLALASLRANGAAVDLTARLPDAPIASSRPLFDSMIEVESSDLTADEIETLRPRVYETLVQTANKPMLCKVHDAWTRTGAGEPLFPAAATLGTLYIARDPRDVACSFAHHSGITTERAIKMMADPKAQLAALGDRLTHHLPQRLLSWSGHAESWLDAPGLAPLLVRYEDMTADTPAVLARVVDYLGWSAEAEAVNGAAEATRFEALQAAEDRQGFREKQVVTNGRFFRRGKAGGWRDTLTAAQAARIERDHEAMMVRLGYLPDVG